MQADTGAKNDHGETAMDLAVGAGCSKAADLLRAAEAFAQVFSERLSSG